MEEKDKPLVSIITVCLNSEKTIEQTIQSVINQTYSNIEYIIIDGKSTDRTLDIIAKHKDKISIYVSEKDAGIYDAMNKGLKLATGELIGIINSDDWYELDAAETIVNTFLEDRNVQVIYGNMNVYEKDKFILTRYPSPIKDLPYDMVLPHPSVFITSEIYKKYRFNIKYKIIADYDLLLKLYSKNYKFEYVNRNISNFRVGGHSDATSFIKIIDFAKVSLHYSDNLMSKIRIILIMIFRICLKAYRDILRNIR
jgi:glycosyltransferase involved in cell wall biosynthesis